MDSTVAMMIGILREKFQVTAELSATSDVNDIGLDSLDVINFLFSVEEQTGIAIPDAAIQTQKLRTLADFAGYIIRQKSQAGSAAVAASA